MIPENKKNIKRTEQTYPFLKTSEFKKKFDFIDSQIDHYYIDQNIYCNEDYRFEILKQNLENSERLEDFIDMDEEEIQKDNLN